MLKWCRQDLQLFVNYDDIAILFCRSKWYEEHADHKRQRGRGGGHGGGGGGGGGGVRSVSVS